MCYHGTFQKRCRCKSETAINVRKRVVSTNNVVIHPLIYVFHR